MGGSRRSTAGSRQRSEQSLLERNIFNSCTGFKEGELVAPAATLANSASTIPIIPLAPAKEASATASRTQRASLSAPAGNPATVSATLSQVSRAFEPVSESSSLCKSIASRAGCPACRTSPLIFTQVRILAPVTSRSTRSADSRVCATFSRCRLVLGFTDFTATCGTSKSSKPVVPLGSAVCCDCAPLAFFLETRGREEVLFFFTLWFPLSVIFPH